MTTEQKVTISRRPWLPDFTLRYGPGFLVCATVAVTSQFLSDRYGSPAMLMALLLGITFHFLAEEGRCIPGIEFTSKRILRLGVALLGVRISVDLLVQLGAGTIILLVLAVTCTILFGLLGARLLGRGWWRFAARLRPWRSLPFCRRTSFPNAI
jgi:uncharacterized membrane protein YadS